MCLELFVIFSYLFDVRRVHSDSLCFTTNIGNFYSTVFSFSLVIGLSNFIDLSKIQLFVFCGFFSIVFLFLILWISASIFIIFFLLLVLRLFFSYFLGFEVASWSLFISLMVFCLFVLSTIEAKKDIKVFKYNCEFVYFSFVFCFTYFAACLVHTHLGFLYLIGGLTLLSLHNDPLYLW